MSHNIYMTPFERAVKLLPSKRVGHKIYIYNWEYNMITCHAHNRMNHKTFVGSYHDFLIERKIIDVEQLINSQA